MTDILDIVTADLKQAIAELPADRIPDLLGELARATACAQLRLHAQGSGAAAEPGSELLTPKQLAAALQVTEPTVRAWGRQGKIPVVQLGVHPRYRLSDVLRAFECPADERNNTGSVGIRKRAKKNGHIPAPLTSHLPVNAGSVGGDQPVKG